MTIRLEVPLLAALILVAIATSTCSAAPSRSDVIQDAASQANQPVAFYGRVVDQGGQPVPGVTVHLSLRWTAQPIPGLTTDKFKAIARTTDANGLFSVVGERGSLLEIAGMEKRGYEAPKPIGRAYWYWAAVAGHKYLPDPQKPETIQLWKRGSVEKLVSSTVSDAAPYDGPGVAFDLLDAKMGGPISDLRVAVSRSPRVLAANEDRYDWSFTVNGIDGGVILTSDSFLYLAPLEGYQRSATVTIRRGDPSWSPMRTVRLYVRSRNGAVYSRVTLTVSTSPDERPSAISIQSYSNPHGSRNLEYDPNQDIHLLPR